MKEAIIYLLFDNWCNSEHEPEVKEAMDKAIQNPTEDTIFSSYSHGRTYMEYYLQEISFSSSGKSKRQKDKVPCKSY